MKSIEIFLPPSRIERHLKEGSWPGFTIPALAQRGLRAFPDKTFIVDSRRRVTYREFDLMAKKISLNLLQAGVTKGDIVGVGLPNRAEFLAMMVAANQIGAVYAPFSYQFREADLGFFVPFVEPAAVAIPFQFRGFEYLPVYKALRDKVPSLRHILVSDAPQDNLGDGVFSLDKVLQQPIDYDYAEDCLQRYRPSPLDLCAIQLTSGTTGKPKGAMHLHETWISSALHQWWQLGVRPEDIMLNVHPLFGAAGLTHTSAMMYFKASMVFMDRFTAPEALELMQREKVSILVGVAAHFIDLLNCPDFDRYDLSSLRLVFSAGGPVAGALGRELERRTKCRVSLIWGCSETKGGSQTLLTDEDEVRLDTVGRPVPYVNLRTVDAAGKDVPPGEAGEIWVNGCSNFVGYFKDPELTREKVEDGWYKTGDVGVRDKRGNLTITGRMQDMILRGAENIYPRELEELLAKHPNIKDVAVVAAPHERLGEIACAYVIPRAGQSIVLDDIVSFLKGKIQVHKIPERLEVVQEFPRTDAGKVMKDKLKEDVNRKVQKERAAPKP
ncbi:MAG: AMP-binding protein, partial [Chloroflexota bacterium]